LQNSNDKITWLETRFLNENFLLSFDHLVLLFVLLVQVEKKKREREFVTAIVCAQNVRKEK
jgi:hypothetical protein